MSSRIRLLIGDKRGLVVAMIPLAIVSAIAEAAILALTAQIAATLVKTNGTHVRLALLHIHEPTKTLIAAAFILAIVRLLLQVPLALLPARVISDVGARLRTDLFQAFSSASWEIQSRDREGQLQETMTNQAGQATQSVASLLTLITATLTFLVLLAFAVAIDSVAAVVVLALAVGMFALLRPLRRLGMRRARSLSRAQIDYATGIAESMRLAEETHVFGTGAAQRRRIHERVTTFQGYVFQTQLISRIGSSLSLILVYLLLVAGLFVLHAGDAHVGALGAVVLILVRASSSGQSIQNAYQSLIQSLPFAERTQEAEQRYRTSVPVTGDLPLGGIDRLAFEHVGYAYRPGQPVLSDIRFAVEAGETIGVIGPSGAGKSTLVQLLLRLRAPQEGRYLINGTPAERFASSDWHGRVAYVPQEPQLLHASVAENIRFYRDIDDHSVEEAARLARIHDDIAGWANGYQTTVGPRADAISGGQQQRICLARALAGRPRVLVLDEPTSALDPKSEVLIQESLVGLKHELTLFIVAHRMSTLDICDRVMIILDGRLAAFDTIGYLQQHNPYYRSAKQLGVEDGTARQAATGTGGRLQ